MSADFHCPGQWLQSESGLHQNWMRDYDPTTGRYLQADPLGLVDGPSVYGYALQNPGKYIDPRGENALLKEIVKRAGNWTKKNIQLDGPGKGLKHGNGRVFGVRYRKKNSVFRLDYQPIPGSKNKSRLHCHIGPWSNIHISLDPRSFFD